MSDTRSRILGIAEEMVRAGGYNGFSFREIALAVGIKSASVHHHFPTKEALTLEVARHYHENFFSALGEPAPEGSRPGNQIELYIDVFRKSFETSGRACLCGVLSNEAEQLPETLKEVVMTFVRANISWLEQALRPSPGDKSVRGRAELIYCAMEGAMGVSSLEKDFNWLDTVSSALRKAVLEPE
ncbi:MAG: TetR/AcrR family transcriptional regulator [Verrucomicrobiota bacterium]